MTTAASPTRESNLPYNGSDVPPSSPIPQEIEMSVLAHVAPCHADAPSVQPSEPPTRAVNPVTGKWGTTLRLTPWGNSLRFDGDAEPGRAYIPSELSDCAALSFRARGIGALLYARPANEPPTVAEIVARVAEGRDAILTAVRELIAEGFVESFYIKAAIPPALRMAVLRRDGFRCVVCDATEDLTADHVIPEAQGGETTFENLQAMCRPCNSAKGDRA
jgi:hypothetical protein